MSGSGKPTAAVDIRDRIRETIDHLEHLLPGQAPIGDFVHHNSLHGYQHLPFPEALAESERLTGARGYLPEERYRECLEQGRITREGLIRVLDGHETLKADEVIFEGEGRCLRRRDVYLGALLHPLEPVTACQLNWQIEEMRALETFQPDVPWQDRERLMDAAVS